MDLLTVEHLTKTYGTGENAVHALDDVSFSVPRGQFLAIIGPSGSGKSTLLHILGGVDRPTSGHVYMNGEDVYSRSDTALAIFRRREVGLIYQFYNLIPVLNVVENITLPVLMDGRKVNDARSRSFWTRSACAAAKSTCRISFPAVSSSASPSAARSSTRRPSCWRTSRPATLTARTRRRSWSC